ncbi:MAG: SDR family NAD(P)-dependent oxidoreductase [Rhodocyclaceae bacterium]|nr:SDR family NAD(P)-dependent oxidoreductase [Rhodocyclaceae bacterium]
MTLNPRIREWSGRRVWIVGASTGIGAALATRLASLGAQVAVSARQAERLEALSLNTRRIRPLPLDVTEPGALARACERLRDDWGGIDLVVLNAGFYEPLRSWELTPERVRRTLDVNLLAVYDGVCAVLPTLQACQGGLVLTGSVAGYGGLPRAGVYGPGKAALINLAEVLYLDMAPRGVGVWIVNPGFVHTPLTEQNEFHMPALISAEEAARHIVAGLASGAFEIHFPRRFTWVLKLLRGLPYRWYFPLIRRVTGA